MSATTLTRIGARANWLISTVQDHNGMVTARFSQGDPPVSGVLDLYAGTSGGICNALCNKWIAEHANGRSLWTWLAPKGTVDLGALSNLMVQFMDKSIPWQDKRTNYLRLYGVLERGNVANAAASSGYNMGDAERPSPRLGNDLAMLLTYGGLKNSGGSYRAISLWGPGGIGHAVCAWIANDVCFFDPNFGEFYFEKYADFARWAPAFAKISGYSETFGGLWVRDFAKAI